MKILVITGCIYAENCNRKSFTGLDYVVGEIVEAVGAYHDVDVFTFTPYPETATVKNGRIVSYTYGRILKNISKETLRKIGTIAFNPAFSIRSKAKAARTVLASKEIAALCRREKYDLIHVHGIGFSSFLCVEIGLRTGIPVLFTAHGLIGYGAPNVPAIDILSERAILRIVKRNNHLITCVSSGVRDTICRDFGIEKDRAAVIYNAVNIPEHTKNNPRIDLLAKQGKKIIISVGTVCERKNQIQLVRAFRECPDWVRNSCIVVVVGKDITDGKVEEYVRSHKLESNVILTGFLSKEDLAQLYEMADYNAMLSRSEGFGLSLIEAASFGIPTLAFSDMDAVGDIYSENSMCLISQHDDSAVVRGLIDLLTKDWDKEKIKQSARRFSKDVYLQYMEKYEELKRTNGNQFKEPDADWGWMK